MPPSSCSAERPSAFRTSYGRSPPPYHEIGVHGWLHRPLLLRGPRATYDDFARARDTVGALTGQPPTLFRPPYGVMSTAAHLAAHRLGLTPVLWTCWGEDWTAHATPESVHRVVTADLDGGGTILLHDSDRTSAPEAWRATLGALPRILDTCASRGFQVGRLRDHGWRHNASRLPRTREHPGPVDRLQFGRPSTRS